MLPKTPQRVYLRQVLAQEWNEVSLSIEASSIDHGDGMWQTFHASSIKQESGERKPPMQLSLLFLSFFAFLRLTPGAYGAPPSKIYGVNLGSW